MDQSAINTLRAQTISPRGHFINGVFHAGETGAQHQVLSPINGQPLALIAEGSPADVDHAVRAARAAFEDGRWSRMALPGARKFCSSWPI